MNINTAVKFYAQQVQPSFSNGTEINAYREGRGVSKIESGHAVFYMVQRNERTMVSGRYIHGKASIWVEEDALYILGVEKASKLAIKILIDLELFGQVPTEYNSESAPCIAVITGNGVKHLKTPFRYNRYYPNAPAQPLLS